MVAKIESGKSLSGALHYNENKVKAGKAYLLATNKYTKSDHLLSFQDKLFRLTDLAGRNTRTRTNTVHLSLNFDVNEKLPDEQLGQIAGDYMERIGFGQQPFLVYKHEDAGHPHIHVLTTNIAPDGKRISLHNIGKARSEPARKAIEQEYGLVVAGGKKKEVENVTRNELRPAEYGRSDTKRMITNIVQHVAGNFRYTSLPEFNAVLGLYLVTAYQGTKGSAMFRNGGLNYWITDNNGVRVGVPIKASSIYQKPTLKVLQARFKLNEYLRKPFKEALKAKVDQAMKSSDSLKRFSQDLQKAQVTLIVRQNSEGRVYGLSFIDHANRTVFNGSDLGKAYSAGPLISSLAANTAATGGWRDHKIEPVKEHPVLSEPTGRTILDELLNPPEPDSNGQGQFGPKKKKKKRRKLNL